MLVGVGGVHNASFGDTQIFNTNSVNLFKNTVIPELDSYVNSVATGLSSTEPVKALTMFREQAE